MTLKDAPSQERRGGRLRRLLAWVVAAGVMVRGHRIIGARPRQ